MLENIRISIQGIWSHKMRSFLTMLGIIIGIASIIAIVSTLKGTNEQIKEDLIGAGNNTVSITLNYGDSAYDQEYGMGDGTAAPLLSDEQKEEVRKLDHIEDATFFYSRSYASNVYYQNTSFQGGSIYGIDMNYLETRGIWSDPEEASYKKISVRCEKLFWWMTMRQRIYLQEKIR